MLKTLTFNFCSNNNFIPVLAGANGAQANSHVGLDVAEGASADLNYYAEYYATGASTAGKVTTSFNTQLSINN